MAFDGIDSFVGGTNFTYGLNNRFYAKRQVAPGAASAGARDSSASRSPRRYYTNQRAAQYDRQYRRARLAHRPSHFSPLALERARDADERGQRERARRIRQPSIASCERFPRRAPMRGRSQRPDDRRLEQEGVHRGALGLQRSGGLDHYINVTANVHTTDNRFGGIYAFNYDVLRSRMLAAADHRLLQRAVLRPRVRIPDLQLPAGQFDHRRALGPPVLPVVHARRPRQLLAFQRRAERRAALTTPADVETDPRHRRGRVRRQPSARSAGARRRRRRRLAPARRHARRRAARGFVGRQSICSIARRSATAIARMRPSAVYHCAGAAHVGRAWDSTEPTFATNVRGTHHLLIGARARRRRRARAGSELGAGLRAGGRGADRDSTRWCRAARTA